MHCNHKSGNDKHRSCGEAARLDHAGLPVGDDGAYHRRLLPNDHPWIGSACKTRTRFSRLREEWSRLAVPGRPTIAGTRVRREGMINRISGDVPFEALTSTCLLHSASTLHAAGLRGRDTPIDVVRASRYRQQVASRQGPSSWSMLAT
jgi:hypothetical protein